MISEKIEAGSEAFTSLLFGGSALDVINRYRELVAANHGRLSSTSEVEDAPAIACQNTG